MFIIYKGKMNSIEKNIVKLFLEISVPNEFLNSADKILFDEFLKGKCTIFLKNSKIDNDSFLKIVSLKNQLTKDINYQNNENVIYFNFMRLVISIMKKNL